MFYVMYQMSDTQFLELIDSIIPLLGNQRTNDIITVRQKNHAQVYVSHVENSSHPTHPNIHVSYRLSYR